MTKPSFLRSYTTDGAMPGEEFIRLVADMRASQTRWPMHPQQASIETMALEKRVDEAIGVTGIVMNDCRNCDIRRADTGE